MSILTQIEKPRDRAPVITICGDAGMGKTSLAATFPKPIFVRVEDGLQSIAADQRPDALPVVKSASQLWEQLMALATEAHDYKTVVIDSVTKLEALFVEDVLRLDGKAKSLNQALGGYGNGTSAVVAMHSRVRKAAAAMNAKGINVVFVAHADVETMRLPDSDDYMRYSLRLPSKSLPPYVDDVDMVGFLRLVTFVKGDEGERKQAVSTGAREVICYATAASVSKNRYGITKPIPFKAGENPFTGLIPVSGIGASVTKDDATLEAIRIAAAQDKAEQALENDNTEGEAQ